MAAFPWGAGQACGCTADAAPPPGELHVLPRSPVPLPGRPLYFKTKPCNCSSAGLSRTPRGPSFTAARTYLSMCLPLPSPKCALAGCLACEHLGLAAAGRPLAAINSTPAEATCLVAHECQERAPNTNAVKPAPQRVPAEAPPAQDTLPAAAATST